MKGAKWRKKCERYVSKWHQHWGLAKYVAYPDIKRETKE